MLDNRLLLNLHWKPLERLISVRRHQHAGPDTHQIEIQTAVLISGTLLNNYPNTSTLVLTTALSKIPVFSEGRKVATRHKSSPSQAKCKHRFTPFHSVMTHLSKQLATSRLYILSMRDAMRSQRNLKTLEQFQHCIHTSASPSFAFPPNDAQILLSDELEGHS